MSFFTYPGVPLPLRPPRPRPTHPLFFIISLRFPYGGLLIQHLFCFVLRPPPSATVEISRNWKPHTDVTSEHMNGSLGWAGCLEDVTAPSETWSHFSEVSTRFLHPKPLLGPASAAYLIWLTKLTYEKRSLALRGLHILKVNHQYIMVSFFHEV